MAFQWIGKSADGETVTLKRLNPSDFRPVPYFDSGWEAANADLVRVGAVIDVETSGLNSDEAAIIEIGLRLFKFNRQTGDVLALLEGYSAFQDPGHPLSEEIIRLTGITDEMVRGQSIDWTKVDSLLGIAQIVIAHNAGFDRPFVDRLSNVSRQKIWGCSLKQIDWSSKGYTSKKLDVLSIYHGFFTDAHRALNDSDALLHLLSKTDAIANKAYLLELLLNARKASIQMMAVGAPFESKDLLKARGYRWDNQNRHWWKEIDPSGLIDETAWLEEAVYQGPFRGKMIEVLPVDHFKGKAEPA
ncbi:MAG: DNA polymerase III subunit epsilon [Proteobacteria bacterium]|nr:DNA polymerase III subunit epsilon [Pseudomonadota bacterium]